MHVHIPQPGNQEEPAAVHACCVPRIFRRLARSHRSNVIALEDDGLLGLQSPGSNVNDRHIGKHQQFIGRGFLRMNGRREKYNNQKKNSEGNAKSSEYFHRPHTIRFATAVHLEEFAHHELILDTMASHAIV